MAEFIQKLEKWDTWEITCPGYTDKNPFVDYKIQGTFTGAHECKTVDGFYDGDGNYVVRFMPSFEGSYEFLIFGSFSEKTWEGTFEVLPASGNNHGPVRVANTYHFAYEDGVPYYSIGTTCYVWELQSEELQKQTLETLKKSAFNKIRFCILPKHYDYNLNEPISYPYIGAPCDSTKLTSDNFQLFNGRAEGNQWDYYRFNPEHFRHIEECIRQLRELSIEADLIVMHPYDRWGFSLMSREQDELYWNYVIARFAAYRNVWWSLANEYDLMPQKSVEDWENFAGIICRNDKYSHLRSIHNCMSFYDYSRPWVTHCSIQRQDIYKTAEYVDEWRERYKKPVVLDEIAYEGNIQHGWGNISGKELVRRFWEASLRGGYAGHGETYMNPDGILWWSHGGVLHGESPDRLKFLYRILSETPGYGLMPLKQAWDEVCATAEGVGSMILKIKSYYLYYYGFNRPSFREFNFDDTTEFDVEVIDTWDMEIQDMGVFKGKFKVELPGKEYMAVRFRKHQA
ncbi:DUF5605 domain-containing protein [Lacrimispora sp. 38-1]|uniref:DUF5605 domain-containing protein n=1 Tax=Lacrimispora sp. 38-1 TaxID=3125778 RepID=UPI003CF06922